MREPNVCALPDRPRELTCSCVVYEARAFSYCAPSARASHRSLVVDSWPHTARTCASLLIGFDALGGVSILYGAMSDERSPVFSEAAGKKAWNVIVGGMPATLP
jgi:hypothetical protein